MTVAGEKRELAAVSKDELLARAAEAVAAYQKVEKSFLISFVAGAMQLLRLGYILELLQMHYREERRWVKYIKEVLTAQLGISMAHIYRCLALAKKYPDPHALNGVGKMDALRLAGILSGKPKLMDEVKKPPAAGDVTDHADTAAFAALARHVDALNKLQASFADPKKLLREISNDDRASLQGNVEELLKWFEPLYEALVPQP